MTLACHALNQENEPLFDEDEILLAIESARHEGVEFLASLIAKRDIIRKAKTAEVAVSQV